MSTLIAVACLVMLGAPAQAAFPGRDGRILWVEGEDADSGESLGDSFYVIQRPTRGESSRAGGYMECVDSPEPYLADGERLCPFFARPSHRTGARSRSGSSAR